MANYVCGFMDTRREFSFQGFTTKKAVADAWVKEQRKNREGQHHRDWTTHVTVPTLRG